MCSSGKRRTYHHSVEWTRSSKGLGRRSLDALRVGVLVLDGEDRPVLVNPSAHEMGLVRPGIAGGATVAHTLIRTLAGQARRSGTRREVELDMPRGRDVEPLGVHIRAVALDDGHVTIEALDVTESHRLNRVRRDFVANVSHELKTPVGALQLLAEALADAMDDEQGADPQAARRFAERIRHESDRLGRLVTELLELSRLQGGEPLPNPEPVPIDRVIAEVIDRTRTTASAKGFEIGWRGTRGLVAYGSESQFVTALANLVENAIAYSPETSGSAATINATNGGSATNGSNAANGMNGVVAVGARGGSPNGGPSHGTDYLPPGPTSTDDPAILVESAADGNEVVLSVTDHGIGIEAKDLDRIFERFYRADRARSRATGGTGLGLAIVKHIATNNGGRVEVRSVAGVGSTFTLRLPMRPPEEALPLPTSAEVGAVAGTRNERFGGR
jgi:two-component system, OmpR family, sensor histidine kinase SenX3